MNAQSLSRYRSEWFSGLADLRRDVLAGMVGTFALIPEVIAFSFVAGVDPEAAAFYGPDRELVRRPGRPGLGGQRHVRDQVGPRGALRDVAAR